MVIFNPEYLAKHPEVVPGLRVATSEPLKDFLTDLAKCLAGGPAGNFIKVSCWRKHWRTKDAKLRQEMLDYVEVWVYVDGVRMFRAPLREIPTRKWGRFTPGASLVFRLPATLAIGLTTSQPSTLDPRGLVEIEVHCEPLKKGVQE